MTDLSFVLWDTAIFGTVAAFEQALFQVAQGGDAIHTRSFTNSRGAGQLPANESMTVKHLGVALDANLLTADYINVWPLSFIEIRVNNETLFECPLRFLAKGNSYGGHYTEAAATNEAAIGLMGNGYDLEIPIEIEGGTAFKVNVFQGLALSAVSQPVRVALCGTLHRA